MVDRGRIDARVLGCTRAGEHELWGALPPAPRLALVGSRAALHVLGELAAAAVQLAGAHGLAVISGGAIGIDAAVHRAALAAGVPQLAVLPCGADRPYPAQHAGLFEAIAAAPGSGVLFAQPRGTPPRRAMFVSRNALTVRLVDACVVLQAEPRSGSETTGRLALRAGKRLAVVVGTPGCNALVGDGAWALPAEPEPFAAALGAWLRGERAPPSWPEHLARLRDALVAHGARGATLEQLGGPTAACALFEAAGLGLVVERYPGTWAAVG